MTENLGDRIRARRAARDAAVEQVKTELMAHIDEHMARLHARLDEIGKL